MKHPATLPRPLIALALLAAPAAADVIVVDSDAHGDFLDLPAAVAAASDGDVLLVRQGDYSPVTIDGKALSLVAKEGEVVRVHGTIVVRNLAAGERVALARLQLYGQTTATLSDAPGAGLVIEQNAGEVRVDGCDLRGAVGVGDGSTGSGECCTLPGHHWGWPAAIVRANPGGAAFVATELRGGRGANAYLWCYCGDGGPGGDALAVTDARVSLYDCFLEGGRGGGAGYGGGAGGAGARLASSGSLTALQVSGSTIAGGRGGDGYDFIASVGGAGGHGVVAGAETFVWVLDTASQGGQGGPACGGAFGYGPDGAATSGAGTIFGFPGVPRLDLDAAPLAREGTSWTLTVTGRPGDQVFLTTSATPSFAMLPSWKGTRLAWPPGLHVVRRLGAIPGSGVLQTTIPITELGPGIEAARFDLQVFRDSAIDGRTLGGFVSLTVLDAAF